MTVTAGAINKADRHPSLLIFRLRSTTRQ